MDNLIERYVYDVVRRLPEKEREDVKKELESNIYDMMPENPGEEDIRQALSQLGPPALLAEKYRQKQRYLISPAYYGYYIKTLKWVLPLLGSIGLIVGLVTGLIGSLDEGMVEIISNTISSAIYSGVSFAAWALFWTTLGFAVAERKGAGLDERKGRAWSIDDLPEVAADDKENIPLSDSIAELSVTVLFTAVVILAGTGVLPMAFIIKDAQTQVMNIFSTGFLEACVPAFAVMGFFTVCECILKIKIRRWTPLVCAATVLSAAVSMSAMLYLINAPGIFSGEFLSFIRDADWGDGEIPRFIESGGGKALYITATALTIIGGLCESGRAVYKTFRHKIRKA